MPNAQLNYRTAICLLALLDLPETTTWNKASNPMLSIRTILDFTREKLGHNYAENTLESIRKYSIKQLVAAGVLLHNPDKPDRAVNSSDNCYQVESNTLTLFRKFDTRGWGKALLTYLETRQTLADQFARHRDMQRIPVVVNHGCKIKLSAGKHSGLIRAIIEKFVPRFVPGGEFVYVGETGTKWGYFDEQLLHTLGIKVSNHGKMPDVVIYYREKNWLIMVEAAASSGPVDVMHHAELSDLFKGSTAGLIYVTALPNRGKVMCKFLSVVSWETEVWCASDPTHLIYFNGIRFLGPYAK